MSDRTYGSMKRPLRERLRAEAYLTRLDWHLEAVLAGKERRSTVRELRRTLADDPGDMTSSIRDLGAPRELAERYAEGTHRRPLWSIGVITAGAALLVYWTVFLSYVLGMLAAVESTGVGEAHATFLIIDVTAFSSPEAVGIGWTGGMAWLVVPVVILTAALLIGARTWRVLPTDQDA